MYGGATDDLALHPAAAVPPDVQAEIARQRAPVLLTEKELDRIAAAGSKPGGAGDGETALPRLQTR